MKRHLFLPLVLCAATCSLIPMLARAEDTRPPRAEITNVVTRAVDGQGFFQFTVLAKDNQKVIRLEYRLTLNGNPGTWRRTPYDRSPTKLTFTLPASTLKFEVRAEDAAHNKSKIVSRTITRAS